jgi:hypothetical protein
LVFTGLAVVAAIFQSPFPATLMFGLVTLYGAQAFIAEALGVTVDQTSVTFPRRPLSNFPLLVFWRARIRHAEIDQITSRSKEQIRLHKSSGERVRLAFANRTAKLQFLECLKQITLPSTYIDKALQPGEDNAAPSWPNVTPVKPPRKGGALPS